MRRAEGGGSPFWPWLIRRARDQLAALRGRWQAFSHREQSMLAAQWGARSDLPPMSFPLPLNK